MKSWKEIIKNQPKVGKLSNFKFSHKNQHGAILLSADCECGNKAIKFSTDILQSMRNKSLISCNCAQRELIKKQGLSNRKFTINNNIYEESSEKSYVIGLLSADGYNCDKGLSITLQYGDRKLIEDVRDFFGYTGNIKYLKDINKVRLDINSKELSNYLELEGIIKHTKSRDFKVLDKYKYDKDFWRGFIDGDGCLYYYKLKWGRVYGIHIVGTEQSLMAFKEYCNTIIEVTQSILKIKNSNVYQLNLTGKRVIPLINELYLNNISIVLKRKKDIAKLIYEKFKERENEIYCINNNWNLEQFSLNNEFIRTIKSKEEFVKIMGNKVSINNVRKASDRRGVSYGYKWNDKTEYFKGKIHL